MIPPTAFVGTVTQRPPERRRYTLNTTAWGGSPTAVQVRLYRIQTDGWVDVSADYLDGQAVVDGAIITTPHVISVNAGTRYALEIRFTAGGDTHAPLWQIAGVL